MNTKSLLDYYRCPEDYLSYEALEPLSEDSGFFLFTREVLCYGRSSCGFRRAQPVGELYDITSAVDVNGRVRLPFDLDELADNLRLEHYTSDSWPHANRKGLNGIVTSGYYLLRPWLGVSVRKYLQRARLTKRRRQSFPHWPVDTSVDNLLERVLALLVERHGSIPFVWFWPEGAPGCILLTHDVEAVPGYNFVRTLMGIDSEYGFRSSFQIVPERRYEVSPELIREIKALGFETNVHDLNHDGKLFKSEEVFFRRAPAIRKYAQEFQARGFRSGALYRNPHWIDRLGFEYDMSFPNAAQLEAQAGGCCTVMPYFIGQTLEIPTTMIQDYSLFHILKQHSIDLWKMQIDLILEKHGLASAIVHPDYILQEKECSVYRKFLEYISRLRDERGVWVPRPEQVNDWWRQRSSMRLVQKNGKWTVEGEGSERARVAFVRLDAGELVYEMS